VSDVILLSLTASLNPTLVAATTVMLLLDKPVRLMGGYLAGAYLTSITLGLIIVFSLSDSSAASTTENTVNPSVDIGLGAVCLAIAFVLYTGRVERLRQRRAERKAAKGGGDKEPPRWQRELSKGSPRVTFLVGAALTLPGASYLAGLRSIHRLHYSTAETVLLVIGFNLVMMWLLEVPLLSFIVAPEKTPQLIARAKGWVSRHAHVFAVRGFAAVGALLIIKGLIGLLA
jgi:hypothetical protein